MTADDRLRRGIAARVMTRIAAEPTPTPARAFADSVRRRAPRDAAASLATGWRLAMLRGRPIAIGTRVRGMALALGVGGVLATSGAVALAGAVGIARQVVDGAGDRHLAAPDGPAAPTWGVPESPSAASPDPVVISMPTAEPREARPSPSVPETRPAEPTATSVPTPEPTSAPHETEPTADGGDHGEGSPTPRPTQPATAPPADGGEPTPRPTSGPGEGATPEPVGGSSGEPETGGAGETQPPSG